MAFPGAFSGTVKSYQSDKGFGFVTTDDGLDIFVHAKACTDGKTLQVGDKVQFDLEDSTTKPGEFMCGNVSGGSGSPAGKGGGKGGGGGQWGAAAGGGWGAAGGSWGAAGGGAGQWGAAAAPRTTGKKMKMCTHFPAGTCRKGANCTFAHSEAEIGTTYNLADAPTGGGGKGWGGAAATGASAGTVTKFEPDKGFGFVQGNDGTQYFFHQKQFVDGSAPNVGDYLTFDLEPSPLKPGQMQGCNIAGGSGKGPNKGKGKGGGKGKDKGGKGKDFGKGGGKGKDFGKGGGKGEGGPRLSGKKHQMCTHFPLGKCNKGENCTFAHSEAEIGTSYGPAKGGGKGAAGPYGITPPAGAAWGAPPAAAAWGAGW